MADERNCGWTTYQWVITTLVAVLFFVSGMFIQGERMREVVTENKFRAVENSRRIENIENTLVDLLAEFKKIDWVKTVHANENN